MAGSVEMFVEAQAAMMAMVGWRKPELLDRGLDCALAPRAG